MDHSDIQVGVSEPLDGLITVSNVAKDDLGVEVVDEPRNELGLDRELLVHERSVVRKLRGVGDDNTLAKGVISGSTGSTEHLEDVLRGELDPSTFLRVVDLRTFNDGGMGRKVDTPSEGGCANEDLEVTLFEKLLDVGSVNGAHTSVMDTEAKGQKVLEIRVGGIGSRLEEDLTYGTLGLDELSDSTLLLGHVTNELGRLGRLLSRMDEHERLFTSGIGEDFVVANFIHDLESLDWLLLSDTNELLLEGAWSVRAVEEEEASVKVDSEEGGNVPEVGKRGRKTDKSNVVASLLRSADSSGNDGLKDRASLVVKEMDLVDDDEANEIGVRGLGVFAGDDIVLLGGGDDDLGLGDLLLGELGVTGQLADADAEVAKSLLERSNLLLDESLHGRNVDNFERVEVNDASLLVSEAVDRSEDGEDGDVGLIREYTKPSRVRRGLRRTRHDGATGHKKVA